MKNTILYILTVVIIIIVIVLSKYFELKSIENEISSFNGKYEMYLDKEIYGNDITTAINKAVNDNENAMIKKDENGLYIQNDEDSIKIEIKTIDIDKIFSMETLYNGGMEQFVNMYKYILFKCIEVKYNSHKRISYMLFEQITT